MSKSTLVGILLCLCVAATAQDTNAVLEGHVTDTSGAVIAGATVKATGRQTGYTRTQSTTNAGAYHLALPAGEYELRITAPNLAEYVQSGIQLNVSRTTRVDVQLQVARGRGSSRLVRSMSQLFLRGVQP